MCLCTVRDTMMELRRDHVESWTGELYHVSRLYIPFWMMEGQTSEGRPKQEREIARAVHRLRGRESPIPDMSESSDSPPTTEEDEPSANEEEQPDGQVEEQDHAQEPPAAVNQDARDPDQTPTRRTRSGLDRDRLPPAPNKRRRPRGGRRGGK